MYRHFHPKFQKEVAILHPGEYYASGDDIVISTVLGSCIAVAFFDPRNARGGLNHFMLPGTLRRKEFMFSESGKYGMFAMELLINELMKMGSRKSDLVAKVFGGGHVLRGSIQKEGSIPEGNIKFAFEFLKNEGIKIESSDVGGTIARKIFFFPQSARILLKRITGQLIVDVERQEENYLEKIRKEKDRRGEITLF